MKIKMFGTRGSVPMSGQNYVKYGGNTTCLQLESDCLPKDTWLVMDAGTGIMPLNQKGLKEGVKNVIMFFTHWHYDHIQGYLLTPWTYMKNVYLYLYGPEENGIGPRQVFEHVMQPPFHPVAFAQFSSHMKFKGIKHPAEMVFIIHPQGGIKLCGVDELDITQKSSTFQVTFPGPDAAKYSLKDCLVVRMYRSNHPERTISYRVEEWSTGRIFVFLTDHENTASIPKDLRMHLSGADLMVIDSQYTLEEYDKDKAGFGHGTPDFCVGLAHETGVKAVGLTHHDPYSSDDKVDRILQDAHQAAKQIGYQGQITACKDFDEFVLE